VSDLEIKIKKIYEDSKIPSREEGNAGWDLYYYSTDKKFDEVRIYPGKRFLFGTGIALQIPENYFGLILGRSGLAWKNGADILAGCCDSSFRGEIKVVMYNTDDTKYVRIRSGDRVGQLVFLPVPKVKFIETNTLEETIRNDKGFGSSGD
jgi:dUTP pyrophosphatase